MPRELLFADDLVVITESEDSVDELPENWLKWQRFVQAGNH